MIESTSHDAHDDFVRRRLGVVQRAEFKLSWRTVSDELKGFHLVSLNKSQHVAEIIVDNEARRVVADYGTVRLW